MRTQAELANVLRRTVRVAVAACLPLAAHGIEPSKAVQVTPLLKTSTTWDGAPIQYPTGQPEITAIKIEIAPGGDTSWHEHPVPSFGVLLEGELEVTLADGRKKLVKAGEALAEVIATPHNGRNVGKAPAKLIVFYAGAVGTPVTVPRPDAKPKTD
jgi:quercetin dioxygenase-like cupin family protein